MYVTPTPADFLTSSFSSFFACRSEREGRREAVPVDDLRKEIISCRPASECLAKRFWSRLALLLKFSEASSYNSLDGAKTKL